MGLFAPPAAFLSQRLGSRHALAAALALIGVFGIVACSCPGAALLILLTIPVGIGMGLGNALLPVARQGAVRRSPVFATGVYAAGINVGATLCPRRRPSRSSTRSAAGATRCSSSRR